MPEPADLGAIYSGYQRERLRPEPAQEKPSILDSTGVAEDERVAPSAAKRQAAAPAPSVRRISRPFPARRRSSTASQITASARHKSLSVDRTRTDLKSLTVTPTSGARGEFSRTRKPRRRDYTVSALGLSRANPHTWHLLC